jgi:hypothetical protein
VNLLLSKIIEYCQSQARPYRTAENGPFRAKSMDSGIEPVIGEREARAMSSKRSLTEQEVSSLRSHLATLDIGRSC